MIWNIQGGRTKMNDWTTRAGVVMLAAAVIAAAFYVAGLD